MDRRLVVVGVFLALLVFSSGGVVAQAEEGTVIGRPAFDLSLEDGRVPPGERTALNVTLVNGGSVTVAGPDEFERRVTLARGVEVTVARDRLSDRLTRGLSIERDRILLATVPSGERRRFSLPVTAAGALRPGEYDLPVRVEYEYTAIARYGPGPPTYVDRTDTRLVRLPITVTERPRLTLDTVPGTPVDPGSDAVVRFRLTNRGSQSASEVGLRLRTDNVSLSFGRNRTAGEAVEVFVPELPPGTNRTVSARVRAPPGTPPGTYLVSASALYRTPAGFDRQVEGLRAGVTVTNRTAGVELRPPADTPPNSPSLWESAGYHVALTNGLSRMPNALSQEPPTSRVE
jgi:hypothetical protein